MLLLDVDIIDSGCIRVDNKYFAAQWATKGINALSPFIGAHLPMENKAHLYLYVTEDWARASLHCEWPSRFGWHPATVTSGRIQPARYSEGWADNVSSADDLTQWLRQLGRMTVGPTDPEFIKFPWDRTEILEEIQLSA